jgi:hypothetical protein
MGGILGGAMSARATLGSKRQNAWIAAALLGLSLVLLPLDLRFVHSIQYVNSDFFTFWLAGRMNWTGENPYSTSQWVAEHDQYGANWVSDPVFSYPVPVAFFLAPLGLLPVDFAYAVWIGLSQIAVVLSVLILMSLWSGPKLKHYALPLLAGAFLFRPTLVTFINGQLGAFVLLILTLAVWLWEKGRWFYGGGLVALVVLKPTLALPILAVLGIWLIARNSRNTLYGIGLSLGALGVLGFVRDAAWPVHFLAYGNQKLAANFGYSPNLWGLANVLCQYHQPCSLPLGALLCVIGVAASGTLLVRGRRALGPLLVMSMTLPIALLVTPYIWAYDQVLLILPITVITLAMMQLGFPYLLAALLFVAVGVLAWLLLLTAPYVGNDAWSALIPLVVWLLVIWRAAMVIRNGEGQKVLANG